MILRCATTNAGKLREYHLAAGHYGFPEIDIQAIEGLESIEPCEEDGETFEANAEKKALHYSRFTEELVFADDSGLEVDALNGAPGVLSARYSPEGTDEANNRLLLRHLDGSDDRIARFVCVIALAKKGEVLGTFRGEVEGILLEEPQGSAGFGYDPLFFYPPFDCTFGEASAARKMAVSHRGEAVKALLQFVADVL